MELYDIIKSMKNITEEKALKFLNFCALYIKDTLNILLWLLITILILMFLIAVVEAQEKPIATVSEKTNLALLNENKTLEDKLNFYITREKEATQNTIFWIKKYQELKRKCGR